MRILSIHAKNFASYKELDFRLTDRGLTLIAGPTGAGKSTLCDLVPWCLFGITAKNGSVDEVLSWPGNALTVVMIELDGLTVERHRGRKSGDNDLFFFVDGGDLTRGKDLNDTQKLINNLLGIDANLYLSGSYFHEFSTTAQFFTTTAKNRRLICEQIVDLSLAKKLQVELQSSKKTKTKEHNDTKNRVDTILSNIEMLHKLLKVNQNITENWTKSQNYKKSQLVTKYDNFELARTNTMQVLQDKISQEPKCPTCGNKTDVAAHIKAIKSKILDESRKDNPYLEQLKALELETSPHAANLDHLEDQINEKCLEESLLAVELERLQVELADLEMLEEITDAYRSVTIQNAIAGIEGSTNDLLNKYFDGEIQVAFQTEQSDKIDVAITKDGNTCSYTQLSKGQRCLLKLCFGISIMRAVSNHSGISFSQIWFDEALDGMDEQLKIKSYRLLEALALDYESVMVVEHSSELKNLFMNKISVRLTNEGSIIEES